jgi:hypothetical protein
VDVEITPEPGRSERRALLQALERVRHRNEADEPYRQAWRAAGLREAIDEEDGDGDYAFLPRSTRGATRA